MKFLQFMDLNIFFLLILIPSTGFMIMLIVTYRYYNQLKKLQRKYRYIFKLVNELNDGDQEKKWKALQKLNRYRPE